MKFDCSSIPSNATITEATVELNRTGNPFGNKSVWDEAHTFELYKITKSWSDAGNTNETTLFNNWNTLAASFDPTIAGTASYTPGKLGWFSFNVLNAVKDFVKNPSTNHGLMLFSKGHVASRAGGCLSLFSGSTDATANLRPKLTITYTTATSIAGSGGVPQHAVTIGAMNHNGISISSVKGFTAGITVYAVNGSIIRQLKNRYVTAGTTVIPLSKGLKSGIFIVKIEGAGVSVLRTICIH